MLWYIMKKLVRVMKSSDLREYKSVDTDIDKFLLRSEQHLQQR